MIKKYISALIEKYQKIPNSNDIIDDLNLLLDRFNSETSKLPYKARVDQPDLREDYYDYHNKIGIAIDMGIYSLLYFTEGKSSSIRICNPSILKRID